MPSGWKIPKHYLKFEGEGKGYDFDLEPWAASKPGPFTFVHIGDSEAMARRVIEIADDPQLRARLTHGDVSRYSAEAVTARLCEILGEV